MKSSKKNNFIIQGSLLAFAGILVRIIGLAYRVPLLNIIGEVGQGYYAAAFNMYQIILLVSSYSLPLAVSKMMSYKISMGEYRNAHRIFSLALIYATVVGFIGSTAAYFGADYFAEVVLKMPYSNLAIKVLAPTIWIMAYLGVYRGYYQAYGNMVPTAISQIIEQIANAVASVGSAYYLCELAVKQGKLDSVPAYGAAGGTLGTGIGAACALLLFLFLYMLHGRRRRKELRFERRRKVDSYSKITRNLVLTVLPVIFATAVYNINSLIDVGVFTRAMEFFGKLAQKTPEKIADEAAGLYGLYSGTYILLTNLPIAISNSLSSSLIPNISKHMAARDIKSVHRKIKMALKFSMIIAVPSSIGLSILATPIVRLLFRMEDASMVPIAIGLIKYGSFSVIFFSLSTVTNGILQGSGRMSRPLINAVFSLVIHLAALFAFLYIFKMGVFSLIYAHIVFGASMCVLNSVSVRNTLGYREDIIRSYIITLIPGILMGVMTYISYKGLQFILGMNIDEISRRANIIFIIIPFIVAIITYPLFLVKFRVIRKKEILAMPKGKKIYRLFRRLNLM